VSELSWVRDVAVDVYNEHTLSGLAVGVVRDGRLDHFTGLGLANAATGRPVEPDTVFRIGSVTKTMTAIGVMQLVEEGALGLDDPVNEHLRSVRIVPPAASAPPVTVRHLLTHTGGLGELRGWSDLLRPTIALAVKPGAELPDLAEYYAPGLRAEVPAGTKWAYANHGFAVLGQLVEDLRGEPFAASMQRRLFEPLEMASTDFLRSDRIRDRLAVGYASRFGRLRPVKDQEIAIAPAGSVFSTTEDMARYVAALLTGGAGVLRPETLAQMLELQEETNPGVPGMGLAFMLERAGEHRVAGHDGGWSGFVSAMRFAPDDGVGVLAFTNTSAGTAPHEVSERVLRRLLDLPEEPEQPRVVERPHLWPELVGVYKLPRGPMTNLRWWPVIGGELEVLVKGGHLSVRAPTPLGPLRKGLRLRAVAEDDPLLFEARHEKLVVPVAFERDAAGRVASVRAGSTSAGFVRLVRRPRLASLRLWGRAAGAGAALGTAGLLRRRRGRRSR
jgi:CubicO group peptidase (beta-lactamase class C family)